MITFLVGLLILLVGYITYSRYVEKQFSPDDRPTPAYAINDGVDFVPLSTKRNQMIQLLSIAGMGPILGVIQGILFGPITFILIPLGCILMGAVHDYSAGMISMRNKGMQVTGLIEKYLGKNWYYISLVVIAFMMLLVAVVFVYTSGDLIASKFFNVSDFSLSNKTIVLIYGIIIAYYLLSTMFSIDKIIGNVYPILGLILIIGTLLLVVGFFVKGVNLREINFSQLNTHPNKLYLIPMFFMT
ncbi:MAG: carbon starvation protein A, partial [Elusimicrobia bacterium]|nr:carbon starvation protein A [Elusimicrobiota bacterium]